jgi:hypothetical protein
MKRYEFTNFLNIKRNKHKEWLLHDRIHVFVKDSLPSNIDIEFVLSELEKLINPSLTQLLDDIFIGFFKDFYDRSINAFYENGAIYVTNDQSSNEDLINDIAHEIAHAAEELYSFQIYEDGALEREFIAKRSRLEAMLSKTNQDFLNPEYSQKFDNYLFNEIGYEKLSTLIPGLFISPYSVTSLREYFANGFENYFVKGNGYNLKKICPMLFNKLEELLND